MRTTVPERTDRSAPALAHLFRAENHAQGSHVPANGRPAVTRSASSGVVGRRLGSRMDGEVAEPEPEHALFTATLDQCVDRSHPFLPEARGAPDADRD